MSVMRLSLSLDLKQNRIRIHKSTLHRLGDPPRVQLLLNPERRELLISCPSEDLPESQDEKVVFDKPGNDGTYQLYSLELLRRIRLLCPELESGKLYYVCGRYAPGMNAALFRLEDTIRAEERKDKGQASGAET